MERLREDENRVQGRRLYLILSGGTHWCLVNIEDLRQGDVFAKSGKTIPLTKYKALSDPRKGGDGVWNIDSEPILN